MADGAYTNPEPDGAYVIHLTDEALYVCGHDRCGRFFLALERWFLRMASWAWGKAWARADIFPTLEGDE